MTTKLILRKIKPADKRYFSKWWRDKTLLKLTSGILRLVSDEEIERYFLAMLQSKNDHHFMIVLNKKVIGHISLAKRSRGWYETQIVIGEKQYWGKGCGTKAIRLLLKKAIKMDTPKIYLEVRPTNIRAIRTYEDCGFHKIQMVSYPKNKYLLMTLRMELKNVS